MPIDDDIYLRVENDLRVLSTLHPSKWKLKENDPFQISIADIVDYLKEHVYKNKLKAKHVLQAGMLLRYFEPKVMPNLFLSWLRNEELGKFTLELLTELRNIVRSKKPADSEIVKRISKTYVFYTDKTAVYAENMHYIKSTLTLKKLQKVLAAQPYSQANLHAYAPFLIELLYWSGIETLESLPANIHEFLADYMINLSTQNKVTPAHVLLAGVLLRTKSRSPKLANETINKLATVALQKGMTLQRILDDKNAQKLHPNLAATLIANINYLMENVIVDEDGVLISDIYAKQFQDLMNVLSIGSKISKDITSIKEILNFLVDCDLSKNLTLGYRNLWHSLIVHLVVLVHKEGGDYSKFVAWVDDNVKKDTSFNYSSSLLEEINKALPEPLKDIIFEMLRTNIKEKLQVYPNNVIAFLHKHKLLNKPGVDIDMYFSEQILSAQDIKRNVIKEHRVKCDLNSDNALLTLAVKIVSTTKESDSVLRFNLRPILQYIDPTVPGYYTFGNLYFSIKHDNGIISMYSPNLPTGPEAVKNTAFEKVKDFILKICNTVVNSATKLVEVQASQYELELESSSRSITPLLMEYKESKDGGVKVLLRAKSTNSLPHKKPSFN